ncbi:MAG: hypothetical protein AAF632_26545 [Bacteroidota bacterium]
MHTNTDSQKSFKIKGICIPVILFIAFFGLGYSIGSEDTELPASTKEYGSSNIFLIDSGQFSFPAFPLPFLNMK